MSQTSLIMNSVQAVADQELETYKQVVKKGYQQHLKVDRLQWWQSKGEVPKRLKMKEIDAEEMGKQRLEKELRLAISESGKINAATAKREAIRILEEKIIEVSTQFREAFMIVGENISPLRSNVIGSDLHKTETDRYLFEFQDEFKKNLIEILEEEAVRYMTFKKRDISKLEKMWAKEQNKKDVEMIDMEYVMADNEKDEKYEELQKNNKELQKDHKELKKKFEALEKAIKNMQGPSGTSRKGGKSDGRGAYNGKGKRDGDKDNGYRNKSGPKSKSNPKPNPKPSPRYRK
ncbi:Piso0_000603 [Millerozyma farinosa CBS 7064]|uniref:Piso0_000603 protein n=1 Tax=Pichia sorbitophila (strain ATCC MYA-4447 / BCRC 22081 / CBS 7064 / NBRC 10061 / NRRL Y-12695) TaxID=559304 RepID=G8YSU3_PICSO|nr:Piso0_000603 [Millerozyma farinosa CBS 7064]CCE73555.1 Piso0_000603 [Millerozyma farinosa CBS 7064]